MKYNMKYWNEHAIERSHDYDIHLFDLPDGAGDMIRVAIAPNTGYTRRFLQRGCKRSDSGNKMQGFQRN